ncbi:hypothetical protein PFISCL1PPCAC_11974, partial [Pristionchus fissidentatus]
IIFSMRLLLVVALSALVSATRAASSASLECGACMLVVAEVEKAVRAVDPKKTIDAGSFRVNHKGEQVGLQKVPFARSNGHIVELLEKACDRTTDYRHVLNKLTGKKVYVNKDSTWLKGDESKSMQSKLHSACNDLIDDHGDELEKFFQKEHDEPARELCLTKIGVCTSVDVSPMPPMEPEEEKKEEEDKNEL